MHSTQACWGKGAGGEGGGGTPCGVLTWNTNPGVLCSVLHSGYSRTHLCTHRASTVGISACRAWWPVLLTPAERAAWCHVCLSPNLCFEGYSIMVPSIWSSVSQCYRHEHNKLVDKIWLFGPFFLSYIFPVVLVGDEDRQEILIRWSELNLLWTTNAYIVF